VSGGRPVVGMVVPTLGERPELLETTLASIRRQDGIDLRLVVVAPERVPPSAVILKKLPPRGRIRGSSVKITGT